MLIRKLTVSIPEAVIAKAHEIYKERNGEYGRMGGFMNKGPRMVADNDLWKGILFELMPEAFHPVE